MKFHHPKPILTILFLLASPLVLAGSTSSFRKIDVYGLKAFGKLQGGHHVRELKIADKTYCLSWASTDGEGTWLSLSPLSKKHKACHLEFEAPYQSTRKTEVAHANLSKSFPQLKIGTTTAKDIKALFGKPYLENQHPGNNLIYVDLEDAFAKKHYPDAVKDFGKNDCKVEHYFPRIMFVFQKGVLSEIHQALNGRCF